MKVAGRVRISAAKTWLPPWRCSSGQAADAGIVTEAQLAGALCRDVPVARDIPAWQMGLDAVRLCFEQAAVDPAAIDLLFYAGMTPVEEEPWSPSSRIARLAGATRAVAIGIAQMSNGSAAALGHAVANMLADPDVRHAACVSAGNFSELPYDRWRTAPTTVFGDGATAVLLGATGGPLAIRSIGTAGNPMLESTYPSNHPYRPLKEVPTEEKLDAFGFAANAQAFRVAVSSAVEVALAHAGLTSQGRRSRVKVVAAPRLSPLVVRPIVVHSLPADLRERYVEFGADTGHLGAGDAAANIAAIINGDFLDVGECALLISSGAGIAISAIVLTRAE
ncbi:3-oxoacyl-[acyl-carrier-protein] synthase-3 [Amycolatopsis pretoriensis]|uniref:3-oxoacyl-[acyl-carrier-protein] synthase-3 n=1 Tax=Amycolatopsis pretoriensis TaxID=218821 RepID=A0A1H5RIE4_9PSEU|nr:hypothetical protein [Amycolatopsis pretoriensis]SEF38099.1 3-oxoacyl-[acyl-carrier-protein] synthase-3 [Amycolatopsis pretoriensis]